MIPFKNTKLIGANVDPDAYHRPEPGVSRGDARLVITRSELMMFASNPSRWKAGYQPKSSDATDFGSLLDTMILDPGRFEEKIAVQPEQYHNEKEGCDKPWNGNATVCKEWAADHKHMMIVTHKRFAEAEQAAARLFSDEQLARLIQRSKKQVMVVGEYHDATTGLVIPVKILIDLVPELGSEFEKSLADYKTARSATPRMWSKAIFDRNYDAQAAMNLDLYVAATNEDRCEFRHVIQENVFPFQPARRIVTAEYVDIGRCKISMALKLYARCLKENVWPSWDDEGREIIGGWSLSKPEVWMFEAVMRDAWIPDIETPVPESSGDIIP